MDASETLKHARAAISPRLNARAYLRTFLVLVLPALAVLLAFTVYQAPLRGDLTRVGGFTENAYGWTRPQERFVPPLAATTYDRPFDVVVLGDSYSVNPDGQTDHGAYWTNHLAQRTGLSVVALSLHYTSVRDLLGHPVFRASPPRVVVLEIVERYLIRNLLHEAERWLGPGFEGCPAPRPGPRPQLRGALPVTPVPWHRDTAIDFNFDQAVDVMWKSAWRTLLGRNITDAYDLPLVTAGLFSSRASDRLLIYDDEFLLADASPKHVEAALCRLRAIQVAVQRNGTTAFFFMAAPDKLSVYSEYVADDRFRRLSKLPEFYRDPVLSQVRLLEPLRAGVACGLMDVYLPNDTHWGSHGHEIVARTVTAAMAQPAAPGRLCS